MQSARPTPQSQRSTRRSTRSPSINSSATSHFHSQLNSLIDLSTTPSAPPNKISSSTQSIFNSPKSIPSLPPLPIDKFNPLLANFNGRLRSVRTQQIAISDSNSITIARIKIPAPPGASAHLIKRFDTDAVSASSFFKTAFPSASEEEEELQMSYLTTIYDTARAGALHLGPDHKLTGVWVPSEHAPALAAAYGLTHFAAPLIQHGHPSAVPKPVSPSPSKPERSSKRPRVPPPSFGATSPSAFSLSLPPPPPLEPIFDGEPAEEPPTVSADENERPKPSHKLIGTDDEVARAKQDAMSLVEGIRESASVPSQDTQATITKKREAPDSETDDSEPTVPLMTKPRNLLSRLWTKSNAKKTPATTPKVAPKKRTIVGLPTSSTLGLIVDEEPLSKRNLAVAGIFIAGAAASIAPYFF